MGKQLSRFYVSSAFNERPLIIEVPVEISPPGCLHVFSLSMHHRDLSLMISLVSLHSYEFALSVIHFVTLIQGSWHIN